LTWTYGGDPAANDRDSVRWLVGDTDTTDQLVTDEEIAYALGEFGGPIHAAVVTAEAISALFSRQADKKIGTLSISASQRAKQYCALAEKLKRRIGTDLAEMFVGGTKISEKETLAEDEDAIQPSFQIGQDDFFGIDNFNRVPSSNRHGH